MSWKSFTYGHAIQYTDYHVGKSCTYWHPNQYIDYHVVKKLTYWHAIQNTDYLMVKKLSIRTREPIYRLHRRQKSFDHGLANQYIDYFVVTKLRKPQTKTKTKSQKYTSGLNASSSYIVFIKTFAVACNKDD